MRYRPAQFCRLLVDQGIDATVGDEPARAVRYLLIGGLAWLLDVIVFAVTVSSVGVASAQLGARVCGAFVAFSGHKLFVFRQADLQPAAIVAQAVRYAALWLLSFTISALALIGLIEQAGVAALTAKVVVEIGIVALNYLVMRAFVFPPTPTRTS